MLLQTDSQQFAFAALAPSLDWIGVAANAPCFIDESGAAWTPIGHNDAITWSNLQGLLGRRDLPSVERHLRDLRANGVTCIRLMLEYAEVQAGFFERPAGQFVPAMVQLWDDLFRLCADVGIRILLTPVDTFWTWINWRAHPWNRRNGGPLDHPSGLLTCKETRQLIKARLGFAAERWGGSGVLFAWDLWNEIHPAQSGDGVDCWDEFIGDLSSHVRAVEMSRFGRSHLQTVSLFGPELQLKPHLPMDEPIFRHRALDFATIHIYGKGTIDNPRDTVGPALAMAEEVRTSLDKITDRRPFLDTEHGPIHAFKDKKRTLPQVFDDECFRHTAWAHLAAGGAGGGMRWPNRHPHVLTPGMHAAQRAMAGFLPLIDWTSFRRRNLTKRLRVLGFHAVGCGDERQALLWLVRRGPFARDGRLSRNATPLASDVRVPGLADGAYRVRGWDTVTGELVENIHVHSAAGILQFRTGAIFGDRAFAITPA